MANSPRAIQTCDLDPDEGFAAEAAAGGEAATNLATV